MIFCPLSRSFGTRAPQSKGCDRILQTNQINNYQIYSSGSQNESVSKSASQVDTEQFLQLLAAQLSNQDVMNPMQDTDFIAQMAQFTSLQALENLNQYSAYQYGTALIGKKVNVAKYDDTGKYVEDTGVVSNCNFSNGETTVIVNGVPYDLSSVMEVLTDSGTGAFQYASSLVGKTVKVGGYGADGKYVEDSGVVSGCNFVSGDVALVVNGKTYGLSSVLNVYADADAAKDAEKQDQPQTNA